MMLKSAQCVISAATSDYLVWVQGRQRVEIPTGEFRGEGSR